MADTHAIDEVRLAAGRVILELTDAAGFDAYAAGWLHDRETGAWRYLLVSPMLASRGPRWVYDRLLRLFRHRPLPEGISPLEVYVIDPEMERAAFGAPLVGFDNRGQPAGLSFVQAQDVRIKDFLVADGFIAFYRRLPPQLREQRRNPASGFDMRVRQLEAA